MNYTREQARAAMEWFSYEYPGFHAMTPHKHGRTLAAMVRDLQDALYFSWDCERQEEEKAYAHAESVLHRTGYGEDE